MGPRDILQGLEARDVPGQGARRDGVGAPEPGLPGPGPPGEVAVDGADADLVLGRRLAGAAIVAGAASRRHDLRADRREGLQIPLHPAVLPDVQGAELDRKSTRLNSSHANISYAV